MTSSWLWYHDTLKSSLLGRGKALKLHTARSATHIPLRSAAKLFFGSAAKRVTNIKTVKPMLFPALSRDYFTWMDFM